MFPLGRQTTVPGNYRPLIREESGFFLASINHWFDGERHASLQSKAGSCNSVMQDLGIFVKNAPDTMTTVLTYD